MKTTHSKFRTIWFFLKKYPAIYVNLFFITITYAVLESINISIFFPLFKSILGGEASTSQIFIFLEKVIALLPFKDPFIGASVLVVVVLIIKEGLGFTRQAMVGYGVGKVVCDVKEKVFNKYINSDYQFFLENKQGDLFYKALLAPGRLGNCLQYIPNMLTAILMTLTIGVLLFSISPSVTLFLLVIGLAFNSLTQLLAKRVSYHVGAERATVSVEANVTANEFIDGVKYIKVFNSFGRWLNNFTNSVRRFKALVIKDTIWLAIPERLIQLLPPTILIAAVLFFRYFRNDSTTFFTSNLALISVYAFAFYRLVPYLTSFGRLRMQIMGTLPDVEILYDILHQKTNYIKDGNTVFRDFNKEVRFENVSFFYKGSKNILRNISFTVEKGKTTAIVGPSGVGKSTLVNLILRLFELDEGKISIDGIDIREIKYSSLSGVISLVSQETFIFNASIKKNILFGLEGASTDRLIEVSKLANAHEFISQFPKGYETMVGDKGLKLSGGQRQRIAIARAILRDPQILILDEATSSLDHYSEVLVQNAINKVSENRTVIIIAHRLSTVINADKIIVLDQGRIIEKGTHDELMKKKGAYMNLCESQGKFLQQLKPEEISYGRS